MLNHTLDATHLLKLFDKMWKYDIDRWNQYTPFQLRWSGGIISVYGSVIINICVTRLIRNQSSQLINNKFLNQSMQPLHMVDVNWILSALTFYVVINIQLRITRQISSLKLLVNSNEYKYIYIFAIHFILCHKPQVISPRPLPLTWP